MVYGFIDESGAPGVAVNNNDFLVVSLVLFDNVKAMEKCSELMSHLRKKLHKTQDYEFHCSSNATKTQREFWKLLDKIDFKLITIALKKSRYKKQATYGKIARLLVGELAEYGKMIRIEMDSNPVLYRAIKRELSELGVKVDKIREVKSHKSDFVQLTDYVVNLSAKRVKNNVKGEELYKILRKKTISFVQVS